MKNLKISDMQKLRPNHKLVPAWDTDPKATLARFLISCQKSRCIHCKKPLQMGKFITYTVLRSSGKILWWHRRLWNEQINPCK